MSRCLRLCLIGLALMAISTSAFAQGSIAGVAKDASGGVLPGVTVEAASPSLIEKVRSVITDGTGQYKYRGLTAGDVHRDLHLDRL